MILRRLSKHVKDQNWFAVVLDFLIVVAGILIAFQITSWNESRQERAKATALLERLETDFADMRERAVEQNRATYENTVILDDLLTRLEDPDDPITDAEAGTLLNDGMNFRLPQSTPISFQEMLAAGRLDLIADPDVRAALRVYQEDARTIERATNLLAEGYLASIQALNRYYTVRRETNASSADAVSDVADLDVAAIRANREGLALVNQLFLSHANMQSLTERQIASIDTVLAALRGLEEE